MKPINNKSNFTKFLDVLRNLSILALTIYSCYLIRDYNWIIALIAAIPIYVILLNLIGFLTLPLYMLTPESKQARKEQDELMNFK
jgi:hypothetical protein